MRTRMYGGVRGRKTKVGGNLLLFSSYSIGRFNYPKNEINTPAATAEPITPEILLDMQ